VAASIPFWCARVPELVAACRLSIVIFCGRIRDLFWRRPQTRKVSTVRQLLRPALQGAAAETPLYCLPEETRYLCELPDHKYADQLQLSCSHPMQGYADLSDQREDFYNRRMYRRIHVRGMLCTACLVQDHLMKCCSSCAAVSAHHYRCPLAIARSCHAAQHALVSRFLCWRATSSTCLTCSYCCMPVMMARTGTNAFSVFIFAGLLQQADCQRSWRLDRCDGASRHRWQSVSDSCSARCMPAAVQFVVCQQLRSTASCQQMQASRMSQHVAAVGDQACAGQQQQQQRDCYCCNRHHVLRTCWEP
jgi:hypothetical protein